MTVCVGLVGGSLRDEGMFRKSRVSKERKEQAHFASSLLVPGQLGQNLSEGEPFSPTCVC